MGLTRIEQTEALTHLLKEEYDAFARLVKGSQSISRDVKIELLSKALGLTAAIARPSYPDEQVVGLADVDMARDDLVETITSDAVVVPIRREKAE